MPTGGPFGANKLVYHDEFVATEIGQVGTQFDGLGHIGVQIGPDGERDKMRFYNGHVESDFATTYGLTKLGVEKLHPIVARGILLDFAASRGGPMSKGECASMDDVKAALQKQRMADFPFMEGDAIMFRYCWEERWSDPAAFNDGSPGICMDTARWVAEEVKAGVTGGDTWNTTDPVPYPDEPGCVFCLHAFLQTRHGIVNQENLALKQLADAGVYVFTYVYSPAPIVFVASTSPPMSDAGSSSRERRPDRVLPAARQDHRQSRRTILESLRYLLPSRGGRAGGFQVTRE
jgi:kynurenine formamidase